VNIDPVPPISRLLDALARMDRGTCARLADLAGDLWHRFDRRHVEIVHSNLRRAFGDDLNDADRKKLCRAVFRNLARVILEFPFLRVLDRRVDEFMCFEGYEHVVQARAKGKGVLIMASHFGNWEMMSLGCSYRCAPFSVVVRPLDNRVLDELVNDMRSAGGNRIVPKKGSIREVLRILRRGELVALLVDQNVDWYDGVFVPFFRDIACTNKALAVLALRTGAPVIPLHNFRRPDGKYQVVIEPELELIRTGDTTSDIEENTALFNRVIEGYIRRYPEQWFWVHQRWKTRPWQPWPKGRE